MINQFVKDIRKSAINHSSNIVLALDYDNNNLIDLEKQSIRIINSIGNKLAAIKINHHLIMPLGIRDEVKQIVEEAHNFDLQVIADLKINDIASTNIIAGNYLWKIGFDAVIANPIAGYIDGIEPLVEQAHEFGKGVILLVYMSHKGAEETYGLTTIDNLGQRRKLYEVFLEHSVNWGSDGVVIGATRPEILEYSARRLNGKIPIFSPGVGAQGGSAVDAIRAGAEFIIIGRSIINSADPVSATEKIRCKLMTK